ncbi:MAG: hypothetical protein WAV78_37260 [Xanthobacteraceae bacterium]
MKMVHSDCMFALAVRDGDDLFLWIRLRRAAGTDIYYVVPTGREDERDWKKWNPHGSWHRDGRLHHKSFDKKMLQVERRQKPDANFEGTHNLITRGLASDEPRAFGVRCDATKFSVVMEIPVEILSPNHYETYTSVDVSESGLQPLLMGGGEKILLQRVFDDAIPQITATVYRWQSSA